MTKQRRGLGQRRPTTQDQGPPWAPGPSKAPGTVYTREYTTPCPESTSETSLDTQATQQTHTNLDKPQTTTHTGQMGTMDETSESTTTTSGTWQPKTTTPGSDQTDLPVKGEARSVKLDKRADKRERKLIKKLALNEVKTLEDLLRYYEIGANDWDYLIIGDGSGQTWKDAIGWGATLICKFDGSRKVFYGAMSNGTNNTAEIHAVLHPLSYLANNINWQDRPDGIKVHVVSDSENTVNGLNKDNPIWVAGLAANRELWMAIHMTRRRGIQIIGHHLPRNSVDLAELGHELANASRKRVIGALAEVKHKPEEANPSSREEDDKEASG